MERRGILEGWLGGNRSGKETISAPAGRTPGGRWLGWLLLAGCVAAYPVSAPAQSDDDGFRALAAELAGANFREKEALAERLLATGRDSVREVLTALLEDRLFQRERDGQVFVVESNDERLAAYQLLDPATLVRVEAVAPEQLERIISNNRLRRFLRTVIARFDASSPDPRVRLEAVRELLRSLDDTNLDVLRGRAAVETDPDVAYEIETALSIEALDDADPQARIDAVERLSGRLNPVVHNRLSALVALVAPRTPVTTPNPRRPSAPPRPTPSGRSTRGATSTRCSRRWPSG